jgi:2-desacetyl-2-hydroxyethyl bacteriochlorophyllide A dehydrogenase
VSRGLSRQAIVFTAPSVVEVRAEPLAAPGAGEILVHTLLSAISAGTELLVYRGLAPASMTIDATLPSLPGKLTFPLKYGYAAVGRIIDIGAGVDPSLRDSLVFSFQPHQTHFTAPLAETMTLPAGVIPERAVMLPSAETAVNLVQDGRPLVGERVVVFGQGVVGLLTTALLAAMPLETLVTLDRHALRRQASLALGAQLALDPAGADTPDRLTDVLANPDHRGADLVFEVSGDPAVLDQALRATGYDGRIVIGSWYGEKRAALDLGGEFHRSRIRLISSQVSTLAPELRGRWTHARRLGTALALLQRVDPDKLITHRLPFSDAAEAYRLLADHPEQAIQVVLTYPESD